MILARILALSLLPLTCAALAEKSEKLPPFELKNRSSFGIQRDARVPFWPIGWSKEKKQQVVIPGQVAAKAFQIQPSHFTVTSVMLSHPPLATINGRAFGEGEFLPVEAGGQPVKVVVKAIRDGGVWLDQSGHQVFVPMRRQELAPRQDPTVQQVAPEFTIKIEDKPSSKR